eukprot:gene9165-10863_t
MADQISAYEGDDDELLLGFLTAGRPPSPHSSSISGFTDDSAMEATRDLNCFDLFAQENDPQLDIEDAQQSELGLYANQLEALNVNPQTAMFNGAGAGATQKPRTYTSYPSTESLKEVVVAEFGEDWDQQKPRRSGSGKKAKTKTNEEPPGAAEQAWLSGSADLATGASPVGVAGPGVAGPTDEAGLASSVDESGLAGPVDETGRTKPVDESGLAGPAEPAD